MVSVNEMLKLLYLHIIPKLILVSQFTNKLKHMVQVISAAQITVISEIRLNFDYSKTDTSGFSFVCDSDGNVDVSTLSGDGLKNYLFCEANRDKFARIYVECRLREVWEPKIIKCRCGNALRLENPDAYGVINCHCGQLYNFLGQTLRPRSEWEERLDDDY